MMFRRGNMRLHRLEHSALFHDGRGLFLSTRIIGKMVFCAFLLWLGSSAAYAATPDDAGRIRYSFGVQEWFSRADAGWRISFPYSGISGTGKVESELKFKKIDSPITVLRGTASIGTNWSLAAIYGFGSVNGGRGSDTDRFLPDAGAAYIFSESEQDISGDVRLYDISLLYKQGGRPWGLGVGFFRYEDRLLLTNGARTVSAPFDGQPAQPLGPFPGLRSTYDFSWSALKIGASYEASLNSSLSYRGSFSVLPVIHYRGEGFWNLLAGVDFRSDPPSFTHESTYGTGYEAGLEFRYRIKEMIEFSAGYQYLYMKTEKGTDTAYNVDGSTDTAYFDYAKISRHGVYAGFLVRF